MATVDLDYSSLEGPVASTVPSYRHTGLESWNSESPRAIVGESLEERRRRCKRQAVANFVDRDANSTFHHQEFVHRHCTRRPVDSFAGRPKDFEGDGHIRLGSSTGIVPMSVGPRIAAVGPPEDFAARVEVGEHEDSDSPEEY